MRRSKIDRRHIMHATTDASATTGLTEAVHMVLPALEQFLGFEARDLAATEYERWRAALSEPLPERGTGARSIIRDIGKSCDSSWRPHRCARVFRMGEYDADHCAHGRGIHCKHCRRAARVVAVVQFPRISRTGMAQATARPAALFAGH